jgi:putative CocE/NonD family hydrolase
MQIERNVRVPMRDGIVLVADVYRPADDSAHPAVVQRTPYDKDNLLYTYAATIDIPRFVARGYAVIVQDCRGRFGSEGDWYPFRHEADDGYDTVEWIAEQPWCDGRVGTYGNSYQGTTALQAAVAAPPHLKAVFAYMAGPAYHNGWAYSGGVLELGFDYFWVLRGAWETLRRADLPDARRDELATTLRRAISRPARTITGLPLSELPGVEPELVPFWRDWLEHPGFDEYWRAFDVVEHADRIEVPVCHISGLYDNFLLGHLALNERLVNHPNPSVRDTHLFVLGPWDHEAYLGARPAAAGMVDFTPDAPNGYRLNSELATSWFDRWLGAADAASQPTMHHARYFDTGTASWSETATWPPPAETVSFLLESAGAANGSGGDGRLAHGRSAEGAASDAFDYDPLNPVPTVGGRTLFPSLTPAGVQDQRAVEERLDILVYTSGELAGALTVAGPASVHLHAATDGEDTDFTAKLVEVEFDGFCRNIAEGIVRARYRNGGAEPHFLMTNEEVELTIDLGAVAHTFAAGHRVRLEISSSNFPRFDRNLNTRAEPARGTAGDVRVSRQHVFHDAERRSRVELPVVA